MSLNREGQERLKQKFPLVNLLDMYERAASKDVFPDYMEGFKLLLDWLGPIDIPTGLEIINIPKLHRNWELNTISDMLNVHPSIVYQVYRSANGSKT